MHRDTGSRSQRGGSSFDGRSPHRPPGDARRSHGGRHFRYPYYPYYYPRFGFSFGYSYPYYYPYYYSYPYYPYYGQRWGYHMPYGHPAGGVDPYYDRQDLGAVALKVRPKSAEVYIDGRYVGTAGSFDGFPSYLWLEPGVYRLELVHEGKANLEREIEVSPGQVLEFEQRLAPGEAVRPEPSGRSDYEREYARPPRRANDYERRENGPDRGGGEPLRDARREPARLVFDVRPDDASVYIDGRFVGTGSEVSSGRSDLLVDAGQHVIQVVHPEFETEEREISVRAGDETLVEITLRGDRP